MNKNRTLLIWIVAFVLVLAGAAVLYNSLKDRVENPILVEESQGELSDTEEESADYADGNEDDNEDDNVNSSADSNEDEIDSPVLSVPDFVVEDADGNEVKLSDFLGKPMVVNFWASWCGPCKSEMPEFDEAYAEYGDQVQFVMVNLTDGSRETMKDAMTYIEENGYSFPVYYDTKLSAAIAYGVSSVPVTYFIDAQGNGIAQARGALDGATLREGIGMITE